MKLVILAYFWLFAQRDREYMGNGLVGGPRRDLGDEYFCFVFGFVFVFVSGFGFYFIFFNCGMEDIFFLKKNGDSGNRFSSNLVRYYIPVKI